VDDTVRYSIDETGLVAVAPYDSFESVVSQIRAAAQAWNGVATSRLKLAFGGLTTASTRQSGPFIQVVFDEVPPGLLALGGPTTPKEIRSRVDGPFVPITQAAVILNRDLTNQPSSSEAFFLTVVHELGHALGLQHTLSSSVMSTSVTRSTTKANPLGIDDVAGLSALYPTARFATATGAIAGRVTLGGDGVNLASVVAMSPQGQVISALTNSDGTYRIEGIPPGQYYVYAHPLPPPVYGEASPANVYLPRNGDDKALDAGPLFETQFYPGVKSPDSAVSLAVKRGEVVERVDFTVRKKDQLDIYAVTAYSFPGNVPVPQGYLSLTNSRQFLVAAGFGLAADGGPAKGLKAAVIGGSAFIPADGLTAYEPDARYVKIHLDLNPFSGFGPRHLLFSLNGDIHMRPSALHLTASGPPFIDAIAATAEEEGRSVIAIAGRNLSRDTRILFDGVPAAVTADSGLLYVRAPIGPPGHRAAIVALNPDGQSSLFLHGNELPRWEYPRRDRAAFSITPSALPAGADAMVEIRGSNTGFRPGQSELGFGSTDVSVRGVWIISPEYMVANVRVAADAQGTLPVTVVSGLEIVRQPLAFQALRPSGARLNVIPPARDQGTGRIGAYPGRRAVIRLSGVPQGVRAADLNLTIGDEVASIVSLEDGLLTFVVPSSLAIGPAIFRLRTSRAEVLPVVLGIETAPPEVAGVFLPSNQALSASRPATQGDLLTVVVSGLGDSVKPENINVLVGGISHTVHQLTAMKDRPGFHDLQFFLGTNAPTGPNIELTVSAGGRESTPVVIPIAPQ
jgi:hypothetical protein